MVIDIKENDLGYGVLALLMALVEVIRDALRIQAIKRVEVGLTEEEVERLGKALIDLDAVIDRIKEEQGLIESVQSIRDGLDDIVGNLVQAVGSQDCIHQEVGQ